MRVVVRSNSISSSTKKLQHNLAQNAISRSRSSVIPSFSTATVRSISSFRSETKATVSTQQKFRQSDFHKLNQSIAHKTHAEFRRGFAKKKELEDAELQIEPKKKVVVSIPESLDVVEKSLATMCDKEADMIAEDDANPELEAYVKRMKYELKEQDGKVFLNRKVDTKHSVTISFAKERDENDDPFDMGKEEEEEDEGAAAAATTTTAAPVKRSEESSEEASEEDDGPVGFKHALTAEINFLDNLGKFRGKWTMNGYAGEDQRLYIDTMQIDGKDGQSNKMNFDYLSHELQDKVYDLLDGLGIDDNLGKFTQDYVSHVSNVNDLTFLRGVKSLLSPQ
jgi:hypothetical protein